MWEFIHKILVLFLERKSKFKQAEERLTRREEFFDGIKKIDNLDIEEYQKHARRNGLAQALVGSRLVSYRLVDFVSRNKNIVNFETVSKDLAFWDTSLNIERDNDRNIISITLNKKEYFKEPGLEKTLTGDGLAQIIAGFIGAPPVTSYGENIGVMAITKIHSIYVIAGAAVLAIVVSFIGKITALLQSIPAPVIGGASIALFGVIAASGLKILVENKVNFDIKRNLLISSVVLVIGIGGMIINITQNLQISSVAIATILGIVLNLVLPKDPSEI